MADFLLRLTDDESAALKAKAKAEGVSMQAVAHRGVIAELSDRPARLEAAITRVLSRDAEAIERLSK